MIPDTHSPPADWGIRPTLFTVAGQPVASYAFFVSLGLVAAIALYYFNTRGRSIGSNGLYIALAAAAGGIIGAKVPIWIARLPELLAGDFNVAALLSGRTVVGGIIGGVLAVQLTKRRLGITERLGNYLVPSICLGVFLGRVGCFLAGCCYGEPTSLAWGVDFGDSLLRHPTQLYEAAFVLGLLGFSQANLGRFEPGKLFELFMVAYFGWRFLSEFVRVNPVWGLGLTYYQVASLAVMLHYLVLRGRLYSLEGVRRWT